MKPAQSSKTIWLNLLAGVSSVALFALGNEIVLSNPTLLLVACVALAAANLVLRVTTNEAVELPPVVKDTVAAALKQVFSKLPIVGSVALGVVLGLLFQDSVRLPDHDEVDKAEVEVVEPAPTVESLLDTPEALRVFDILQRDKLDKQAALDIANNFAIIIAEINANQIDEVREALRRTAELNKPYRTVSQPTFVDLQLIITQEAVQGRLNTLGQVKELWSRLMLGFRAYAQS